VIRLRSRNGRLVNRGGLLVPSCNECPPCVFLPPDLCPDNPTPFGLRQSGVLQIDKTFTWGSSPQTESVSINPQFRVNYKELPTIRVDLELDVIEYDIDVSSANSVFGRLSLFHANPTQQIIELENTAVSLPIGATVDTFAGRNIQRQFANPALFNRVEYNPLTLSIEIQVISVSETVPGEGTATIEIYYSDWVQTSPPEPRVYERNTPIITTEDIDFDCDSQFSLFVGIDGIVSRSTNPLYTNIDPTIKANLDYNVRVDY
jgi:hypothetical protein